MSEAPWWDVPCTRCSELFETFESYEAHLPACFRATGFRSSKFREGRWIDPLLGSGVTRVRDSVFEDRERTIVAPEEKSVRVEGQLRNGRIRTIPWEALPKDQQPSIWKKVKTWLRGQ